MTTPKPIAAKAPGSKPETTTNNVIAVAQWAETTAIARDGLFRCVKDLAEIYQNTAQAFIGGFADYGNEVRDIGSTCATVMTSNLTEVGRTMSVEGASPVKTEEGFTEVMKQFQRLMDANSRLAECQINTTLTACQGLSTLPSCALASLGGHHQ